jgi:hypothetical protein
METTSHNKSTNQELTEAFEEDITQSSTSVSQTIRKTSEGTTSQKKKKPTEHQILDKLKNSIRSLSEAVEEDNTPINSIENLKEAKNFIENKLRQIENYVKLTINAVYEAKNVFVWQRNYVKRKAENLVNF